MISLARLTGGLSGDCVGTNRESWKFLQSMWAIYSSFFCRCGFVHRESHVVSLDFPCVVCANNYFSGNAHAGVMIFHSLRLRLLANMSTCRPRWLSWMRRPNGDQEITGSIPARGWQHSFAEIDHEIFFTVILSLPLIQEGQLSVSGERMCTILVNCLED